MTSEPPPPCWYCAHLTGEYEAGNDEDGYDMVHTCKAFPGGIPPEVFWGDVVHAGDYPGAVSGIAFEPGPDIEVPDHILALVAEAKRRGPRD